MTGSNGFAARHLRSALAERGVETVLATADVRDAEAVARDVKKAKPDAIAHLAAITSVADAWSREHDVWEVNALGTLNVALAVKAHAPHARLLAVSSSEVYGHMTPEEAPIIEARPVAPASPYGRSKAAAELACARTDIDLVVARPFPHTGPGQSERFAVASFASQIARIEAGQAPPVMQVGNLTAQRDYSDVRDVADAYVRLLNLRGGPHVFNIATGTAHAMSSILEQLLSLATMEIAVEVDPGRMRPTDIPLLVGSHARLTEATGWSPVRPLGTTLADVLDAARQGVTTS